MSCYGTTRTAYGQSATTSSWGRLCCVMELCSRQYCKMAAEPVFDTERLIQEVKERPCLWDLSSDDYANRIMKKQKWEEITLLFGGDSCTSAAEKNELCK